MTSPVDPLAPLNEVLSEVIDVVREVRQARWRFAAPAAFRDELGVLFEDARSWGRLLVEQDDAHGVSPLASMPSVAGRPPVDLGPEAATPEGAREAIDHVLERLGRRIDVAIEGEQDDGVRAALIEVQRGVLAHRHALAAL
jgi:hypothetical protein